MSRILNPIRRLRNRWKSFWAVNWIKTYYLNYKMFPKAVARQLPVIIYGPIKLSNLTGKIILGTTVRRNMIRIGWNYEKDTLRRGATELNISGILEFEGYAQISKDCFVYVGKEGHCVVGNMVGLASRSQLMCESQIHIGDWTRISAESQLYDTDFHSFINTETKEVVPHLGSIKIGSHNFIGYRSSIKKNTQTPDYCTVASNSLCTGNYRDQGENILLGGIPAKKIKENYTRLWDKEKARLRQTFRYK